MAEGSSIHKVKSMSLNTKFAILGFGFAVFFVLLSKITSVQPESQSSQTKYIDQTVNHANDLTEKVTGVSSPDNPVVQINTSVGNLIIELYPEHAPVAVEKLMQLIGNNYYSKGTVLESKPGIGFVIAKVKGEVENFANTKDEINNLRSDRGSVAIIKSASSPAYLNNIFVGYQPQPKYQDLYLILGHVVDGLDEVEIQSNGKVGQVSSVVVDKNQSNRPTGG